MSAEQSIEIDLGSSEPAYRQVADAVRKLLVARAFSPGERLVGVRELAVQLGVHFNTVAQAYRELAEEGWLELTRGRGAIVRDRATPIPSPEVEAGWLQRLQTLVSQGLAAGLPPATVAKSLAGIAKTTFPQSSE